MKKIISILLCAAMLVAMFAFAGCEKKADNLKFGFAVESAISAVTSATADAEGKGEATINAAAVLLDVEGRIVKCVIDTAAVTVGFTAEGKAVPAGEIKTKYELGADYGMVAYAGAAKEWFEQADAFCQTAIGKTAEEVKALAADGGKGTEEVLTAGCTISVTDFVAVVAAAAENAANGPAVVESTLQLGFIFATEPKDATADAAGANNVDATISAAAVDAEGKVVAMATDAVQAKFAFDAAGVTTTEAGAIKTKDQLGTDYGMVAYGGATKEWNEQADVFDAACIGLTATEISALVAEDGYKGVESLVSAGCTIGVADMVKAAVKAATVA